MPTLLHVTVSPRGTQSISRRISDAAVDAWKARNPAGRMMERDLSQTPLTLVNLDWIVGSATPPEKHTAGQKRALALSDELVAELLAADEIIIATPMYDFAIPAALKVWIEHITREGKTFRATPSGLQGLLANKKLLIVIASGGNYGDESGLAALDYELPYLRHIFGFLGIHDVHFIQAGGTSRVAQGEISTEEYVAAYLEEVAQMV
jgi:FMN-dependent NADH-azoreductase